MPSKSSVTVVPPPPPDPSGSNRIQSKDATGTLGARSDSAAGPIRRLLPNALSGAGRPTGANCWPSVE